MNRGCPGVGNVLYIGPMGACRAGLESSILRLGIKTG